MALAPGEASIAAISAAVAVRSSSVKASKGVRASYSIDGPGATCGSPPAAAAAATSLRHAALALVVLGAAAFVR